MKSKEIFHNLKDEEFISL